MLLTIQQVHGIPLTILVHIIKKPGKRSSIYVKKVVGLSRSLTGGIMSAGPATVRILIKGGKVVNDDFTQEADVYIENGIIQQVGKELMIPGGAKVIDATGKLVLPGGIDTSVHLTESFMNATTADDFYSGTKVQCVHFSIWTIRE